MTGTTVVALIGNLLMVLLPVAVLLVVRRQRPLYWGWIGIGALMFVAAQVPKAVIAMGVGLDNWTPGWPLAVFAALLPGVWEEIAKWLPLRVRRPVNWDAVLSFALGFGGIESIMIGVQTAALAIVAATAPEQLPPDVLEQYTAAMSSAALFTPLLAVVERGAAMSVHAAWAFMNAKAVLFRRVSLLFLAMLMHTVVDIGAAYYQFINNATWVIIALEAAMVALALLAIRYIRQTMAEPWPDRAPQ